MYHYPLLYNKAPSNEWFVLYSVRQFFFCQLGLALSWLGSSASGCSWTVDRSYGWQSHIPLILHQTSLGFQLCRIRVHEKEDLQSLGLELTHHSFHQTLLTKSNHKPGPDSRHGETDSTTSWEDLQIHIAKGIDTNEANDWGHQYIRSTRRCHHQIDKKCSYNMTCYRVRHCKTL